MATVTPNFNWPVPTSTDLVKDGATAIEALGDSIDASLVDLKGGTSGQVLAKNSNTDMDFTWVTDPGGDITGITVTSPITGGGTSGTVTVGIQDATTAQKGAVQLEDSIASTSTTTAATPNSVKTSYDLANAAIAKSIVDAKGDIIAATAADTVSRLAVGANNTVLTADSSTATGLKWATPSASGGGFVKITAQSFSSSSAVNVNDVFSATYKNYKVMLNLTSSAGGINCQYRLRVGGADNTTSNYATQYINVTGTSVTGGRAVGQTAGEIVDIKNVNANQELTFFQPFATELTYVTANGNWEAATPILQQRYSGFNATTSFTGFTIIPTSGTVTGSLIVYGLAD
jgi:hypothetical protein